MSSPASTPSSAAAANDPVTPAPPEAAPAPAKAVPRTSFAAAAVAARDRRRGQQIAEARDSLRDVFGDALDVDALDLQLNPDGLVLAADDDGNTLAVRPERQGHTVWLVDDSPAGGLQHPGRQVQSPDDLAVLLEDQAG